MRVRERRSVSGTGYLGEEAAGGEDQSKHRRDVQGVERRKVGVRKHREGMQDKTRSRTGDQTGKSPNGRGSKSRFLRKLHASPDSNHTLWRRGTVRKPKDKL